MKVGPRLTAGGPHDYIGALGPRLQPFSGSEADPSGPGLFGPCGERRGGGIAEDLRLAERDPARRDSGDGFSFNAAIILLRDCSNSSVVISPRSLISRRSSRVKPTVGSDPAKMLRRINIASPPPSRIRSTNIPTQGSTSFSRVPPVAGNRTSSRPITMPQRLSSSDRRGVPRPGRSSHRPAFP